jgi:hypothetical protein
MNYFKYVIMKHFFCVRHFVEQQLIYENNVHYCCTHTHEYERLSSCCVRYGNISECILDHSHIFPLGFCNVAVKPPSNTCCVFIISEFVSLHYTMLWLRVWWGWNLVLKFCFQWIEFKSIFLSYSEMLGMN